MVPPEMIVVQTSDIGAPKVATIVPGDEKTDVIICPFTFSVTVPGTMIAVYG